MPRPMLDLLRRRAFALAFSASLLATVLPLWVARHLPAVDLPQHLFLIHVLRNLGDSSLPYSDIYVARPGLTYLTFYYSVRALAGLVGEEIALKLWLTAVLAGIPLSLWALLRALGRNRWLALLACPLVFTDNFYWGLVSFQSALPFTFLSMAAFARALEAPAGSRSQKLALFGSGLSLLLLQLTHAAGMILPALALPLILATTPTDWRRRLAAVGSLVPGVALFFAWLLSGVTKNRAFGAPGEPWKASATLFHKENFVFAPLEGKLSHLLDLLSSGFWEWADRPAILAALATALLAAGLWAALRPPAMQPLVPRLRPLLLFALALAFYLFLPQDVQGYMYGIYPRYAQVAALLAIPALRLPEGSPSRLFGAVATAVALYAGINLCLLFSRFDQEAQQFERVAEKIPSRARVMHLVLDRNSRVASHAVYLHYAALAALRRDGVPSFSLATDPSFPVGYREGAQPPASPWEWRPEQFRWTGMADWYDVYLVRGPPPEALFREHTRELEPMAEAGGWMLLRRKTQEPAEKGSRPAPQ